jgi:hypothetical protein
VLKKSLKSSKIKNQEKKFIQHVRNSVTRCGFLSHLRLKNWRFQAILETFGVEKSGSDDKGKTECKQKQKLDGNLSLTIVYRNCLQKQTSKNLFNKISQKRVVADNLKETF